MSSDAMNGAVGPAGEAPQTLGQETVAVATKVGQGRSHRPLNPPLYLTSVWEAGDLDELARLFAGGPDRGFYTRFGHPTVRLVEHKVAALEGAEDALLFASGMGAISTALHAVLESGAHVVAHRSIFGQTIQLLERMSQRYGVKVDFVDATNPAAVERALEPSTRLVYLETPSNPLLDILDIRVISAIAHARGALVFVDGTFGGPIAQRPLALGADLSLQSASKSLGGHADLLAGCAAGGADLIARIREVRVLHGPSLDPHAAWLLNRGLQTLPLRVRAQSERALHLARLLHADPSTTFVRYPLLDAHPAHAVARQQMDFGGSTISFAVAGGLEGARRFARALAWIPIATSLGSVYTTLEVPEELDFAPAELGDRVGAVALPDGLIRLSVGLEAIEDLDAELRRGLAALQSVGPRVPVGAMSPTGR